MKAKKTTRSKSRSELESVPGIGRSIAGDLHGIGIDRVAQLAHADAQDLYDRVCEKTGTIHDRCLLYTFRCAVYYASRPVHDPEKLKWWNWKDDAQPFSRRARPSSRAAPARDRSSRSRG